MSWKLKSSKAKNTKRVCVIKVTKNNLGGIPEHINQLGEFEYDFRPTTPGIYRVLYNTNTSKNAKKGCILCYRYNDDDFLSTMKLSDDFVRTIEIEDLNNTDYLNNLGAERRTY